MVEIYSNNGNIKEEYSTIQIPDFSSDLAKQLIADFFYFNREQQNSLMGFQLLPCPKNSQTHRSLVFAKLEQPKKGIGGLFGLLKKSNYFKISGNQIRQGVPSLNDLSGRVSQLMILTNYIGNLDRTEEAYQEFSENAEKNLKQNHPDPRIVARPTNILIDETEKKGTYNMVVHTFNRPKRSSVQEFEYIQQYSLKKLEQLLK